MENPATKLLFVLTKGLGEAGAATRAVQFASIAADKGHYVEIFLVDEAVHWAQLGIAEGIATTTGEQMIDLLHKLQQHQTIIHVCEACANKRLIPPDELIDRARISGGPVLVDLMAAPDYKVFIF
ncbi:MAG: DsrE family protein [Desulfobacteraceae bacterium]